MRPRNDRERRSLPGTRVITSVSKLAPSHFFSFRLATGKLDNGFNLRPWRSRNDQERASPGPHVISSISKLFLTTFRSGWVCVTHSANPATTTTTGGLGTVSKTRPSILVLPRINCQALRPAGKIKPMEHLITLTHARMTTRLILKLVLSLIRSLTP
jgi:hypothetical protein